MFFFFSVVGVNAKRKSRQSREKFFAAHVEEEEEDEEGKKGERGEMRARVCVFTCERVCVCMRANEGG